MNVIGHYDVASNAMVTSLGCLAKSPKSFMNHRICQYGTTIVGAKCDKDQWLICEELIQSI